MSTDTKVTIGTILATAVALGGLLGGLMVSRVGNVETKVRNVRTEQLRTLPQITLPCPRRAMQQTEGTDSMESAT